MMNNQRFVADQRGMPVEDVGGASIHFPISNDEAPFYYLTAGVRTPDGGESAGTVVEAILTYGPIANSSGDQVGNPMNTSLLFTSTAFTNEIRLNYKDLEQLDGLSFSARLSALESFVAAQKTAQAGGVTTPMANGDYVVDYRKGILWGKKASTQTALTSISYNTLQKGVAISATPPGVNSFTVGEDEPSTNEEVIVKLGRVRRDTPASSAGTDGDWSTSNNDANGNDWVSMGTLVSGENDVNKFLSVSSKFVNASAGKPTSVTYTSFQTQAIASSVPLTLVGARIVNTTASPRYLFFNNASSIGGGATPSVAPVFIAASSAYNLTPEELGKNGELFATALTIGNSSTAATFTAATAGDLIVTLYYTTATS